MPDARKADRYLISMSKCQAVLETDDGQRVDGHLCDVSTAGCLFVTPAGRLKLRMDDGVVVTAGEHRLRGRVIRSSVFGTRANIGIDVAEMPEEFLDGIRRVGGALRYDHRIVSVVGILTMPVAVQAMRLIGQPETEAVDLQHCTGLELAGAGFLIIACERGKKIINVNSKIAKLVDMAGITLACAAEKVGLAASPSPAPAAGR